MTFVRLAWLPLLIALWLTASLLGKLWRYAPTPEPVDKRTGNAVQAFLGAQGWTLARSEALTAGGV